MKSFKFRLEPLLMLRKSQTARAMEEYAKAMKKKQESKLVYDLLMKNLESLHEAMADIRQQMFEAGQQKQYLDEIKNVKERLTQAETELKECEEEEQKQLSQFLEAKRNEEVLVKLKERKNAQYFKDLLKEEEKLLEDVGNGRRRNMEVMI